VLDDFDRELLLDLSDGALAWSSGWLARRMRYLLEVVGLLWVELCARGACESHAGECVCFDLSAGMNESGLTLSLRYFLLWRYPMNLLDGTLEARENRIPPGNYLMTQPRGADAGRDVMPSVPSETL
jgi:hypothetical protein